MNCGRFWLTICALGGIFWGLLLGGLVYGIADQANGLIAGVFFGEVVFHLGLLMAGMAITVKRADDYRIRYP